jgi:hypothetical protein
MESTGQFEEALPCGGKLRVGQKSWDIGYSFAGRDRRYKTSYISIPGNEVASYVNALRENWAELERLKAKLPENIKYEVEGKQGMTIHLGTFDGLFLKDRFKPIATKGQLENVIRSYEYAMRKAAEIQALLSSL